MDKFLNRGRRQQTGAVLTEGIVGVVMLSMTIIGGVCFLVNSGLCTFYKHKVAFVTIEAARYAAQLPDDNDLEGKTRSFANKMLNGVGLPNGVVNVQQVDIEDSKGVKVEIEETAGLLKGIPYLPGSITFKDQATAPRPPQRDGFMVFRIVKRSGQVAYPGACPAGPYQLVYVPIVGKPAAGPYFFGGSITPNTGNATGIAPIDHWNPQNISDKRFLKHIAGIASNGGSGLGPDGVINKSDCTFIPPPMDTTN